MTNIDRISSRFILLFKALFILYPLFVMVVWFGGINIPYGYFSATRLPVENDLNSIRLTLRMLGCLVSLIPASLVMLNFYYLIKLFQLYQKNWIFKLQNVMYTRKIGYTLLLQVLATLLIQPIVSLILTMDAPKGGHTIAIGLSGDEISNLVIGGIVVVISWIMEEGRKLQEETSLTI